MKQNPFWRPLLVLAVASSLALVACEDDNPGVVDILPTFSGVVTDSVSGVPVDSARISIGDTLANPGSTGVWYTDSTGHYAGVTSPARITIYVQKAGYFTKWSTLDVRADVTNLDFELVSIP